MTDVDLVYDVEIPPFYSEVEELPDTEENVESSSVGELTDEEIYDAILDQYVLPWEVEELPDTEELPEDVPQNDSEQSEQQDTTIEVDPQFQFTGDDEFIIDSNGNAIFMGDQSQMQNNFANLLLDINMCGIEIIYKYNLTMPVMETKNIVVESDWIHNLKAS